MSKQLPKAVNQFRKRHPKVWKAFNELGERCHEAGPLDEKSRRLVKLAMSIGAGPGRRYALGGPKRTQSRVTPDEIDHVAVLAISTLGLPAATRAMTWISDYPRRTR